MLSLRSACTNACSFVGTNSWSFVGVVLCGGAAVIGGGSAAGTVDVGAFYCGRAAAVGMLCSPVCVRVEAQPTTPITTATTTPIDTSTADLTHAARHDRRPLVSASPGSSCE